jgi:uncharacterized protein YcbK (DUF882 family)
VRRRDFLAAGCIGFGTWLFGCRALAGFDPVYDDPGFWERPRVLDLVRVETGERVTLRYWADGEVVESGYEPICHLLRDVRVNRSTGMDPDLLDKLWVAQCITPGDAPLEILSAYRTAVTNRLVGGARRSLHTLGQAVDFRIPGVRPSVLAHVLRGFEAEGVEVGGVGFYGRWVHADTGDARAWKGRARTAAARAARK